MPLFLLGIVQVSLSLRLPLVECLDSIVGQWAPLLVIVVGLVAIELPRIAFPFIAC